MYPKITLYINKLWLVKHIYYIEKLRHNLFKIEISTQAEVLKYLNY